MDRALLETSLARQLHWISGADAKVSPVLAVDVAMLGSISAFAAGQTWTLPHALCTSITLTLLAISFVNLFLAGFPRTSGPSGSMVFFGGITSRTQDEFIDAVRALSEPSYLEDLCKQVYRNAEIAGEKYKHVRSATKALLWSLVPWALTIYLLYGNKLDGNS